MFIKYINKNCSDVVYIWEMSNDLFRERPVYSSTGAISEGYERWRTYNHDPDSENGPNDNDGFYISVLTKNELFLEMI